MSIGIKCKGADCSIKETCYRYTAKPKMDQQYIEYNNKNSDCSGFTSEESQINLNGDLHKVGNEEYTRGVFGSFHIYRVKVRDLFVTESHFRNDGIRSHSSIKGNAYIPNTSVVSFRKSEPISKVDITILASSIEDINIQLDHSKMEVYNSFNKNTVGHYTYHSNKAIGISRLHISVISRFCHIHLDYKIYDSLIKSLKDGILEDLEFDIQFYSVFTSTSLTSPEDTNGYLLAEGDNDGESNGAVLEMNTRLHTKIMNIEVEAENEKKNSVVKLIEEDIVSLNTQILVIRRICKYGFIALGILVFLNLFR